MEREIKFRAWHIELEDMTFSNGSGSDFWYKVDKYPSMYHVMQYTGLKDKNGKQIYEGDIVQMVRLKDNKKYFTGKVTNHGFHGISIDTHNDYMDFECPGYSYEVIGNIYETPHLLNKEQSLEVSDTTKTPKE